MGRITGKDLSGSKLLGFSNIKIADPIEMPSGETRDVAFSTDAKGRAHFFLGGEQYFITHEMPALRITDATFLALFGYNPETRTFKNSPPHQFNCSFYTEQSSEKVASRTTKST